MSRRYLIYKLWAAGRLPGYTPGFADIEFWLTEGAPPAGQVRVDVEHVHHHQNRR